MKAPARIGQRPLGRARSGLAAAAIAVLIVLLGQVTLVAAQDGGEGAGERLVHVRYDDKPGDLATDYSADYLEIRFVEALLDDGEVTLFMHLAKLPPGPGGLPEDKPITYTLVLQVDDVDDNGTVVPATSWTHFVNCTHDHNATTHCIITGAGTSQQDKTFTRAGVPGAWLDQPGPHLQVRFPLPGNVSLGDIGGMAMAPPRDDAPASIDATDNFLPSVDAFRQAPRGSGRTIDGDPPWWKTPGFIAAVALGTYVLLTAIERIMGKGKNKGGADADKEQTPAGAPSASASSDDEKR